MVSSVDSDAQTYEVFEEADELEKSVFRPKQEAPEHLRVLVEKEKAPHSSMQDAVIVNSSKVD